MKDTILSYVKKLPVGVQTNIKQTAYFEEDGTYILLILFKDKIGNDTFTEIVKTFDKLVKKDNLLNIKLYNYDDSTECLKYIFGGK